MLLVSFSPAKSFLIHGGAKDPTARLQASHSFTSPQQEKGTASCQTSHFRKICFLRRSYAVCGSPPELDLIMEHSQRN